MNKIRLDTKKLFSLLTVFGIISLLVYQDNSYQDQSALFQLDKVTKTLISEPFMANNLLTSASHLTEIKISLKTEEKIVDDESNISSLMFNGQLAGPVHVVYQHQRLTIDHVNPTTSQYTHHLKIYAQDDQSKPILEQETEPGSQDEMVFTSRQPGVYLYRVLPKNLLVSDRLLNSASGALIVLPKEGLVDPSGRSIKFSKAYFINKQDFYFSSTIKHTNESIFNALIKASRMLATGRNQTKGKSVFKTHTITNLPRLIDETIVLVYAQPDHRTKMQILGSSNKQTLIPLSQRDNSSVALKALLPSQ